jgi:PAS domain S-box-containing protein/putative nucleotidyltransferase with HDIG domain
LRQKKNDKPKAQEKKRMSTKERVRHFNLALRAIRNIDQLIAREDDRDRLLQGICERLTEIRGYHDAWIALFGEDGKLITTAKIGLGKKFTPLIERFKRGDLTACARKALDTSGVVVTEDPSSICADCPLAAGYAGRGAMTVRLEHGERIYGLLSAFIPKELVTDEEEQILFDVIAKGISFALHGIEVEEERERAEESLRESEEMYRELVNSSIDGIISIDMQVRITLWNPGAERIFGYTEAEMLGQKLTKIVPKRHLEAKQKGFAQFKKTGQGPLMGKLTEITGLRKGGIEVPIELSLSARETADTRIVTAIVRDVTERVQALKSLRQSEEMYRSITENSLTGFFVVQEGRLVFVNRRFAEMHGYKPEELIGHHSFELIHPDDREMVWQMVAKSEQGELPLGLYEMRAWTKDKRTLWVAVSTTAIEYNGRPAGLGNVMDITERKKAEEGIQRLLNQQTAINRLALSLGESKVLDEMYSTIYENVYELMDSAAFMASLYDSETQRINPKYVVYDGEVLDVGEFPPIQLGETGHGAQCHIIREGEPTYFPNLSEVMANTRPEYNIEEYRADVEGKPPTKKRKGPTNSALYAPMKLEGKAIGILQVQSHRLDAYSQEDMDLLAGVANVAAVAIDNARLHQEMRKALEDTIRMAGLTLSMRDPYTATHQERVAELARAIAQEMDLSQYKIEGIYTAGLLHDIGKIAVPADILGKPTKLSDAEFELIKSHPKVAYDILKETAFPWPIADIVLQHHERLDGSGYPNGLTGDEIMLEARVLGVADVVEAMSSHRPYRPALGLDAALKEIMENQAKIYDPQVVKACLRVFDRGFEFKKQVD